ncbi:hypothetical protein M5K25_022382 [Dendrobium thyrsiflorum]|uniref:Uncharacterized protein n=1 Tax=Dendrobium thyrsiflorum TaxID=117978 RepID=A0ABD0UC96_DENTH
MRALLSRASLAFRCRCEPHRPAVSRQCEPRCPSLASPAAVDKMKSKANGSMQRAQMMDRVNGDGPNWILIAGGALLGTLSIRIGCKLKQALEAKGLNKDIRGNKNTAKPRLGGCQLHSNLYQFAPDKDCCYHFISDFVKIHDKIWRYAGGPRGRCPLAGFDLPGQVAGSRGSALAGVSGGSALAGVSGGSAPGTNFYCKVILKLPLASRYRSVSLGTARYPLGIHRYCSVSARYPSVLLGIRSVSARYRSVLLGIRSVSARYRSVSARYRSVSARYRSVSARYRSVPSYTEFQYRAIPSSGTEQY